MYSGSTSEAAPLTVPGLRKLKQERQPISCLTAYDASFAACLDAAGIDVVLVGDSLGMVVQGHRSTLPVTVDHMVYHGAAVARGLARALLMIDTPFQACASPASALACATRLVAEGGAQMVKMEGAGHVLEAIRHVSERDIPVCAHLGLTPQSVHRFGGFRVQGRDAQVAERLLADARAVQDAGADLLVLECVPTALASRITEAVAIPTIGIGAGPGCDGQVLVLHDLLGLGGGRRPRFVKDFLADGGNIEAAIRRYAEAVRERSFPAAEHGY